MRLVCGTEQWMGKYQELGRKRNIGFQPWPSRLTLFVADGQDLVAGVMVYDSTGPFLFFEHLITNPDLPGRLRLAAVKLMAVQMIEMCRHFGKVPQITVRHKGIIRILESVGLVWPGAGVMTCSFEALERPDEQIAFPSPQRPGHRTDSAPTDRVPPGDPEDDSGVYAEVLGGASGGRF